MTNDISRQKIWESAVKIISSILINQSIDNTVDIENTFEMVCEMPYDETPTLLKEVVIKAIKYEAEIIDYVSSFLNKWKFNRLNVCVQAILITSLTVYKYIDENIDKAIIIDVSVDLAKKYCESQDYKFVNAILDNCLNESIR